MSPNLASASFLLRGVRPLGLLTSSYLLALALAIPKLAARIAPLLGGGGAFGSALLSLAVTSFKASLCLGFLPPLGLLLSPFCLTGPNSSPWISVPLPAHLKHPLFRVPANTNFLIEHLRSHHRVLNALLTSL